MTMTLIDITEVATGITVTVEWDDEGAEFWWEDGNGSCDCNRWLYFQRGQGIPEDEIVWPHECSEGQFTVELREASR